MTGRVFVDTNILIYALDPAEPLKRTIAADLLRTTMGQGLMTLSPQSLNEAYRVLVDRKKMPRAHVREYLGIFAAWCIAPLDAETTIKAWSVQDETGYSWWDSLLLAAALRAKCRLFLSEDMKQGHEIQGMTIVDPFQRA